MGKGDRKRKKKKKSKKKQNKSISQINKKTLKNPVELKQESQNKDKIKDGKDMSCEIVREKIEFKNTIPIPFLKWHYSDKNKLDEFKKRIKPEKQYNISLKGNTNSNLNIENLSGIISENKLHDYIKNLLPCSFILRAKIELKSPYFSSDDDDFYLIQNPCLKEKVFKVPMIRGSDWKGAIAKAGKDLINKDFRWFSSYVRVFGTGSDEYRKLIENIKRDKDFKENLIKYLLFELGKRLTKDDIDQINDNVAKYLENLNVNRNDFKNASYLQVHKGRAIFYSTYFNRLSLEVINPHSRKTRAGTNPIHYEVVPKETDGTLQIVYIPFDAVLTEDEEIKKQVKVDIEFLTKCIEKIAEIGVGAKEKLGWGRFEITNRKYSLRGEIEGLNLENWHKCEGGNE